MARSLNAQEAAEALAKERATVACRFCGGKPTRFPPAGRPQTDAVCEDCAPNAPGLSILDVVSDLTKPRPPAVDLDIPRARTAPAPSRKIDRSQENFT
jgi:hypothetical protein